MSTKQNYIFILNHFPGDGNGNPLQYFCLENSMDRGAWQGEEPGRLQSIGSPRVRYDKHTHTNTHNTMDHFNFPKMGNLN